MWILLAACTNASPAHPDAAVDATTVDVPFPCGTSNGITSCDKATQYCFQIYAGFAQLAPQEIGCTALPSGCTSCACITPTITQCDPNAITCEDHDGAITAACNLP